MLTNVGPLLGAYFRVYVLVREMLGGGRFAPLDICRNIERDRQSVCRGGAQSSPIGIRQPRQRQPCRDIWSESVGTAEARIFARNNSERGR